MRKIDNVFPNKKYLLSISLSACYLGAFRLSMIDCFRFLLKKKYPKPNFKVETVLLRFGHGGRNSFRTDLVIFDCAASELQGVPIEKAKEHIVLVAEIKRDNTDATEAKQMQVE